MVFFSYRKDPSTHTQYTGGNRKTFSVTKQRVVAAASSEGAQQTSVLASSFPPFGSICSPGLRTKDFLFLSAPPRPSQQGVEASSPLLTLRGPSPGSRLCPVLRPLPGGGSSLILAHPCALPLLVSPCPTPLPQVLLSSLPTFSGPRLCVPSSPSSRSLLWTALCLRLISHYTSLFIREPLPVPASAWHSPVSP